MGTLTIVGMADGKKENLTLKAWEAITNAPVLFLQTAQVPFGNQVKRAYTAFDDLYEAAEDFEALKLAVATKLVQAAIAQDVVFCALGDVLQNQLTNAIVTKAVKAGICPQVVYGLPSGGDALAESLKHDDVLPSGVTVVSGQSYNGDYDNDRGLLIYEIDSVFLASEIKISLLRQLKDEKPIYIYIEGQNTKCINLEDLDREEFYDYSFNAYIPPTALVQKVGFSVADLADMMVRLRSKEGCPWDKEQTHDSLKRFLVEEAYEVFDAIKKDDVNMLYDELGDVLLQVVFHAQIGKEHRTFDMLDVTTAICSKMINRHPHVFSNVQADTSDIVLENWEKIKTEEKGIENYRHNLLDVPKAMPALMRAQKVQKRAAACGFDWADYKLPLNKVREELDELEADIKLNKDPTEELGDVLFAVTNLARHLKLESETVLYSGVEKFIARFSQMEELAEAKGQSLADMTLDEMDDLWEKVKRFAKTGTNL